MEPGAQKNFHVFQPCRKSFSTERGSAAHRKHRRFYGHYFRNAGSYAQKMFGDMVKHFFRPWKFLCKQGQQGKALKQLFRLCNHLHKPLLL